MNWNSPDLRGRRQLGLALFLISLGMLFGASIAAFAYLRLTSPALQGSERIELPLALGVSTAVLLGAGVAMYKATQNAKRGHFPLLRRWLAWAWVTSALFIAVQVPALVQLLDHHRALEVSVYGIAFALVVVHALHVVGGMVPLLDAGVEGEPRPSARPASICSRCEPAPRTGISSKRCGLRCWPRYLCGGEGKRNGSISNHLTREGLLCGAYMGTWPV